MLIICKKLGNTIDYSLPAFLESIYITVAIRFRIITVGYNGVMEIVRGLATAG